MKILRYQTKLAPSAAWLVAGALLAAPISIFAADEDESTHVTTTVSTSGSSSDNDSTIGITVAGSGGGGVGGGGSASSAAIFSDDPVQFTVQTTAASPLEKNAAWLGVAVSDTTEPLSAQLGLKRGEGLVVNLVSSNSPAAGAGLQKNDVLVKLDGQMLVDPAQLRKLVQMHAAGESAKIEYIRGGKHETASAKLITMPTEEAVADGSMDPFKNFQHKFFSNNFKPLQSVDTKQINADVQRALAEAERAVHEAVRESQGKMGDFNMKLQELHQKLGDLAEGGVRLNNNSIVVVKNDAGTVRTLVTKDDSGTYILVADPAKHLTVHDAKSQLLFDGPVDSPADQKKVPAKIWKKVQPMIRQLDENLDSAVPLATPTSPAEPAEPANPATPATPPTPVAPEPPGN
jgi:hypothetical protein